jgi:hypothetical protein
MAGLAFAVLLILHAAAAQGGVIHYWQFEDGAFLDDSTGSATLTNAGGTQLSLPTTGPGSTFTGLSGGNAFATDIDFTDSMSATLSDTPTGDFTVELFGHFDAFSASFGSVLAGFATSQSNNDIGWVVQARTLSSVTNNFILSVFDGASYEFVASGIGLQTDIDYYLAASWDQDGDATFYVQDLTNGTPLQVVTKSHTLTAYNPINTFSIGATSNGQLPTGGLFDEVRLSNSVLAQQDLLIESWSSVAVPLPSSVWLFAAAAVLLPWARRRTQLASAR